MPYKNREDKNANSREYRRKNPPKRTTEQMVDSNLWSHHRLRLNDFEELLKLQNFSCMICDEKFETRSDAQIDHDHSCSTCGEFKSCKKCRRGLLCIRCNHFIGHLEKKAHLIQSAFEYLGWENA